MWAEAAVIAVLVWNTVEDLKKQEVHPYSLLVFGIAGIAFNAVLRYQSLEELLLGIAVGIFFAAVSVLTRGALGFGDALLLCVTGIFLGGTENLRLLLKGMTLCWVFLGLGLLAGKVKWKQQFPFVPFLLAAKLGELL